MRCEIVGRFAPYLTLRRFGVGIHAMEYDDYVLEYDNDFARRVPKNDRLKISSMLHGARL